MKATSSTYRALSFLLVVIVIHGSIAQASETVETSDFTAVHRKAIELGNEHGPENVLLVFDIDNTLLAANQPLGSDQWYDWQSELLKKRPNSALLVAKDQKGLLDAQGIVYSIGSMHPPQKNLPMIVNKLQTGHFPTLILTSRAPQYRNATMRHLEEWAYTFADNAPGTLPEFRGVFRPYDLADVTASGLKPEEVKRFALGKPREVSYDQGIFMTAGMNKGAMLLIFLSHCTQKFSVVIFVDDKEQHTESVYSAIVHRGIEVYPFRYSNEDDEVADFSAEEKLESGKDWLELQAAIEGVFK